MRRFPFAFVILGVVGLLAAGALVLGVAQSPTGTDLAVHNGVGETLEANAVTGTYTTSQLGKVVVSFAFTAPDAATEVARGPHGAVKGKRTVHGADAVEILEPLGALLNFGHFAQQGSSYVSSEPAAKLVPAAERSTVTGTYRATAQIESGYLVGMHLAIKAVDKTEPVSETIDYRLTHVGSWSAP